MLPIRPYKEGVSQALLNQPGIDHLGARIDIGQDAAITVSSLLIELQSDFPPYDERLVEPFGFQIEWLLKFGRVDAQIPNFPAIFEENGIPIVDPLDSDEFLGSWWSGECRFTLATFVPCIAATTSSAGQHPDEYQHRQP